MTDFTILRADDKAVCDYGKNTAVLALYEALITPEHGAQLIEALIGSMNNPQDAELLREGAWYAAVSMTFADYVRSVAGLDVDRRVLAIGMLLALTAVNCLGVRAGSNVQNTLMVMKIVAILMLLLLGWRAVSGASSRMPIESQCA